MRVCEIDGLIGSDSLQQPKNYCILRLEHPLKYVNRWVRTMTWSKLRGKQLRALVTNNHAVDLVLLLMLTRLTPGS